MSSLTDAALRALEDFKGNLRRLTITQTDPLRILFHPDLVDHACHGGLFRIGTRVELLPPAQPFEQTTLAFCTCSSPSATTLVQIVNGGAEVFATTVASEALVFGLAVVGADDPEAERAVNPKTMGVAIASPMRVKRRGENTRPAALRVLRGLNLDRSGPTELECCGFPSVGPPWTFGH